MAEEQRLWLSEDSPVDDGLDLCLNMDLNELMRLIEEEKTPDDPSTNTQQQKLRLSEDSPVDAGLDLDLRPSVDFKQLMSLVQKKTTDDPSTTTQQQATMAPPSKFERENRELLEQIIRGCAQDSAAMEERFRRLERLLIAIDDYIGIEKDKIQKLLNPTTPPPSPPKN